MKTLLASALLVAGWSAAALATPTASPSAIAHFLKQYHVAGVSIANLSDRQRLLLSAIDTSNHQSPQQIRLQIASVLRN